MAASIIGEDLTITGNIVSKGEVHIAGEVQGDVFCLSLAIGEGGRVKGAIVAEEVIISGRVTGSIHALAVTLEPNSHIEGDICHQTIRLEQGSYFEGRSRRADNPLALIAEDDSPVVDPVSKAAQARLNASLQRVA